MPFRTGVGIIRLMGVSAYQEIKSLLGRLYLDDPRPWLVGLSGGKDSTMIASLIVETVASIPESPHSEVR